MKSRDLNTAVQAFREKGGTLRTRDLIAQGGIPTLFTPFGKAAASSNKVEPVPSEPK